MTVNTQHTIVVGVGNGVSLTFPITYQFYSSNDIVVEFDVSGVITTQLPSTYSVTGGNGSTGAVTFLVAPPAGTNVNIKRILQLVQQATYTRNDPFPSATHEIALDRIVMMVQQTLAGLGNTSSVSPEFIMDIVGAMFTTAASSGITFNYNDLLDQITATVTAVGFADAAADGKYYVRRNNGWIEDTWANIVGKPATFAPSVHTHVSADVTDLTPTIQGTVAPMLTHPGHINLVFTYDPVAHLLHGQAISGATSNYRWIEATTLTDPGSGNIAINAATMDLATHLLVSNTDFDGFITSIATAIVTDIILISNLSRSTPGKFTITAKTAFATYTDLTVTADATYSSGNPQAADSMTLSRQTAAGGITDPPADGVNYGRKNLAWTVINWTDVVGKPATFPPSAHTHPLSDITGLTGSRFFTASGIAGTANAVTAATDGMAAPSATMQLVWITFASDCTGAMTLKLDGFGVLSLLSPTGAAIATGEVVAGIPYLVKVTSTDIRIQFSGAVW